MKTVFCGFAETGYIGRRPTRNYYGSDCEWTWSDNAGLQLAVAAARRAAHLHKRGRDRLHEVVRRRQPRRPLSPPRR